MSGAQSPVWSSSNTAVATVDQNGVFTAKSVGKARIYAAEGSERAYCDVTVKAASPAGISASDMTLTKGATGLLFSDTNGVKWFSTNKNVATVSGGTVTAKDNKTIQIQLVISLLHRLYLIKSIGIWHTHLLKWLSG